MKWTSEIHGHKTEIAEVGIDSLVAHCYTCNQHLGKYPQALFPKYRLAMAAARTDVRNHSQGLDSPVED